MTPEPFSSNQLVSKTTCPSRNKYCWAYQLSWPRTLHCSCAHLRPRYIGEGLVEQRHDRKPWPSVCRHLEAVFCSRSEPKTAEAFLNDGPLWRPSRKRHRCGTSLKSHPCLCGCRACLGELVHAENLAIAKKKKPRKISKPSGMRPRNGTHLMRAPLCLIIENGPDLGVTMRPQNQTPAYRARATENAMYRNQLL